VQRLLVLLVAGCGRLGFDGAATDGAPGDGASSIDAQPDAPNNAVTATFGNGSLAMHRNTTADTYLNSVVGTTSFNYGGDDVVRVRMGEEHGLLRFDLTVIPATATVVSAELQLVVDDFDAPTTLRIHRVLESWTEGALLAIPGACNWIQRDSASNWSDDGAAPPASSGPELTSFAVPALGDYKVALPASLVQAWVATPANNHGVLFRNDSRDRAGFVSSEGNDPDRPLLSVVYVP
jgi:hypothetical protein